MRLTSCLNTQDDDYEDDDDEDDGYEDDDGDDDGDDDTVDNIYADDDTHYDDDNDDLLRLVQCPPSPVFGKVRNPLSGISPSYIFVFLRFYISICLFFVFLYFLIFNIFNIILRILVLATFASRQIIRRQFEPQTFATGSRNLSFPGLLCFFTFFAHLILPFLLLWASVFILNAFIVSWSLYKL